MKRLLVAALLCASTAFGQDAAYKLTQVAVRLDGGAGGAGFSTPSGCSASSVPIFLGSPVALGCDAGLTYDAATDTLSTGRILVGDGSAAAPSVAYASEPGTGWFRPGTLLDQYGMGGSAKLVIIGQSSQSVWSFRDNTVLGFSSGDPSVVAHDAGITRAGAASLRIGLAPSATPVANTLIVGESGAGTDIAGANGVIQSGAGTGSGFGSQLDFRVPVAHGSDAVAQTMKSLMTIDTNSGVMVKENFLPSINNQYGLGAPSLRFANVYAATASLTGLAVYADNAAALTGGLVAGDLYRTSTGVLMVTY